MGVLVALALVSGGGQAMPPPQDRGAPKIHDVSSPPAIAAASDLPPGDGPRGTSGEVRDDSVGFAAVSSLPVDPQWSAVTMAVAHPNVPPGTPVEITALDTGRTILALVVARETSGAVVSLSPATAQALGVGDRAPVRVRAVVASPQDQTALRAGQAASARLDAPPALLTALRRKVPMQQVAPAVPRAAPAKAPIPRAPIPKAPAPKPLAKPKPSPVPSSPVSPTAGGFVVQVAALSSAERAAAMAHALGGHVVPLGRLFRVQLGPFGDKASAQRARDGAARHGYGDAQILHTD